MKKLFSVINVLLFSVLFLNQSIAQVVTFTPSFATQRDSLKVIFNASEGNRGLENFTGDVFLHTGVITSESTNDTDWKYIPFGWETNDPSVQATSLGNNKWEFTYKPSIREFFEVTDPNEQIEKVAIVYKGVQGGSIVAEGKDVGNTDIFIELTSGEAAARFLEPQNDSEFLRNDETLKIVGIGTVSSGTLSLSLLKNDKEVATTADDTLRFTYNPESGDSDVLFKLVASNGTALSDTADFFVTVRENDGALLSRPNGLRNGITYNSDSSVQLSLFAPAKDFVYVIGDFNDWSPSSAYLMNKEVGQNDDVWFWLEIDGLTSGEEYGMQYLVDGTINIADPYSELILDEFNDRFIPNSVYPDLKPYPVGKTDQAVTLLSPGATEYVWQVTDYEKPAQDELIIYELLIRDFIADHNFTTLIDTLDYLENLGVNVIQLMPIGEFDGNESWGYNPSFHYAFDKYYGTPDEFKRFVDEVHSRGIMVVVDMVLNHASGQNPYVRLYNGGGNPSNAPTADNPFFYTEGQHPANVFNDMNHFYDGTEYYSKRVMEHWLKKYRIDGFRFDLSKGFTEFGNTNWDNYNPKRIALWKRYADHMWSINPDTYVILEHFGPQAEENELSNHGTNGLMFWVGAGTNASYNEATMGYHDDDKSNLYGIMPQSKNFDRRNMIGYFESHDEQWLMFKNISFGNSSGDYNIRGLSTALDRMELAGVFFFPLEGPKMIWQFGELGYGYGDAGEQCLNDYDSNDCPDIAPDRTANKPIRWDYFENQDRKDLYNVWSQLIRLRTSSDAFSRPDRSFYALSGPIKYYRLFHSDTDVVAIGNFGVVSTTQTVDYTKDGVWYDFFNNTKINVTGGQYQIQLEPGEYRLFTTKKFDIVPITSELEENYSPTSFTLHQNYPNPFNPSTNINFDVPKIGQVTLEVFNILGQKVATLVNEIKTAGSYTVRFDASGLSSGVYIARFTADNKVQTQEMMLLK